MTTYTHTVTRELSLPQYVGQRIRQLREARGWSGLELANRMGLTTRGLVPQWESGRKHAMTLNTLQRIADAFEVPVRELLP